MARFGLGERMEEVERSMFQTNGCKVVDGLRQNIKDNEIIFYESQEDFVPTKEEK